MKIQCSCGAKYAFDVTPEMGQRPVQFICPACGLDASDFVNNLVRQELGLTPAAAPAPAPVAVQPAAPPLAPAPAPAPATPRSAPAIRVQVPAREPSQVEATAPADLSKRCPKHPSELTTEQCYVCSKPICPKCMELFGYVCSPLCKAKAEARGIEIPVYAGQKSVMEARLWRRAGWIATATCAAVLAVVGLWVWYAWFGSAPRPVFSVRFTEAAHSGQTRLCGKDQIVYLHGGTLARHDLNAKKQIWSRELIDRKQIEAALAQETKEMQAAVTRANNEDPENVPKFPSSEKLLKFMERAAAAALELRVHGQNIWVLSPGKLTRYDWETGNPVKEMPLGGGFDRLICRGDELLLMAEESGRPVVTRINLSTCDSRTEEIGGRTNLTVATGRKPSGATAKSGASAASKGPRATATAGLPVGMPGKDAGKPMDPAKVAEQAQHLSLPAKIALPAVLSSTMAQERTLAELNDEPRRQTSFTASSPGTDEELSLIPTKDGFMQFSVKLLEHKVVTRSAMKPAPAKSALEGNVTVARTAEIANEILNEIQRDRGGDTVEEDESRYQVTLRRADARESWSGEVVGEPTFHPLQTVNVVTANKTLLVFDKANKKIWQSTLNYNVHGGAGGEEDQDAPYGQGPCVEHKGGLYVFDQGVLTAFDLATGAVRWRLPSVGITGLFFDDKDMIYVNSTTASPESIRYSRQIDVTQKASTVVLKIDSRTGKNLWTAQPGGLVNYVSGPFVYTVQSYAADDDEEESPYTVQTGFEIPAYLRIKRINPKTGHQMWEHFQQRAPLDVQFDKNCIQLVFKKEVQVLRFLSF